MNPRIRELAEQAGINMDAFQFSGTPIKYIVDESLLKKFAELVVGECVNMIEAAAENADDEDVHGMRNAAGLISRAFITFHDADLKND
jgi:hypothetical protein